MNTSPSPLPARSGLAVSLVMARAQLAVAVSGLACAIAHAIRVQVSDSIEHWDRVPAPLVITGSAIAVVVLIRRSRLGGAMTAALLPAAAHVVAMFERLPVYEGFAFGSWVRQALTSPFGQLSMQPNPVLARISDWACMAAVVIGVAMAVVLARAARRKEPRSPAPPGSAEGVVMVMSVLAIVAYWAGDHLSQLPVEPSVRLPVIALAAAAVAALIEVHTRWAAGQGLTAVAAISAGVSGMVLIVPLGRLLWPLFQRWPWPPQGQRGVGLGFLGSPARWEGLAEALTSLGALLVPAAVAVAALTAAHRAAAIARRTNNRTQD
ncbi:hypothetical protein [Actinomadura alba]|uniref:Integral membrane protein n=1 Tax=Actinomadura alba TaxID=406431 RepID=A0ABR7LT06_9ACTN|nr:hypothetical protein [Actinomadura alba]MBC6467931.1 hypothetical protein [Actinomadura alba]